MAPQGSPDAVGIVELWLDGVRVARLANAANGPQANIRSVSIPYCYDLRSPRAFVLDFDDVAIGVSRVYPSRGFRVYHNAGAGPIDYATVRDTRSETISQWTSPALACPATWRFGVRAYNEHGEERNIDVASELTLEASGGQSPARPNHPVDLAARAVGGGCVEVSFGYDDTGEAAACSHFHICADDGAGAIDYASPLGAVDRDDSGPISRYAFLTDALADGVPRRFGVRAVSADDVEDDGTETVAVTPDACAPAQPVSLSASVVR